MSTIGSILKDEPASVIELNPSLPRHMGRIIRRCLAKHPDRRYQTALDLRNELQELKAEIESGDLGAKTHVTTRRTRSFGSLLLLGVGFYLTLRLRFLQLRGFGLSLRIAGSMTSSYGLTMPAYGPHQSSLLHSATAPPPSRFAITHAPAAALHRSS